MKNQEKKQPSQIKNTEISSRGFTLVEMMVSLVLFSIIIIAAFAAFGNIGILRTQVSSALDLNTELYGATEKFVGLIKA